MITRKFKDLTIRDAFMFAAVMSDPEICRRVIELALGIPISEVHIQTEKTMAYHSEYHGVRLDVYAADMNRTYRDGFHYRSIYQTFTGYD